MFFFDDSGECESVSENDDLVKRILEFVEKVSKMDMIRAIIDGGGTLDDVKVVL